MTTSRPAPTARLLRPLARRARSVGVRAAFSAETGLTRLVAAVARRRGWSEAVLPYTGIGAPDHVRLLARVVLAAPGVEPSQVVGVDGWRRLLTLERPGAPVRVEVAGQHHHLVAGRGGFVDADVPLVLPPGVHTVRYTVEGREPVPGAVLVASPDATVGAVCDIDDTAWVTGIRHPLRAAWRTFFRTGSERRAVPGTAALLRAVVGSQEHPAVVYLSNGPWNLAGPVGRFLDRNGFPDGALLMTDWGPTGDRLFRDGQAHKRGSLERLVRDLPWVRWVLVGDDGEHDPDLYADLVRRYPGRVAAVAVRQVRIAGDTAARTEAVEGVPFVRAPDGDQLRDMLAEVIAGLPGR